jgi:hypothetical protein
MYKSRPVTSNDFVFSFSPETPALRQNPPTSPPVGPAQCWQCGQ